MNPEEITRQLSDLKEIVKSLQDDIRHLQENVCVHDWKKEKVWDNHDGWSYPPVYTEFHDFKCAVYGMDRTDKYDSGWQRKFLGTTYHVRLT